MGICKLTLNEGKFVKSHILPKALTKPRILGNKFVQLNNSPVGHTYIQRPDSWYDKALTIREGEDILADLDSFGIEQLRKNKLVWSNSELKFFETLPNLSIVRFEQPEKMRIFFLSLLWRAAATVLQEFEEVVLPQKKLEQLRRVIIGLDDDIRNLYPISLVNIATLGHTHNLGAIKQTIDLGQNGYGKQQIYRFYMSGLIIHFYIDDPSLCLLKNPIPYESAIYVGEEQTLITHVAYEDSFQLQNLKKHNSAYKNHHNNLKRLF